MMCNRWASIIRVLWLSLMAVSTALEAAESLQTLVQTYRKTPNAVTRAAVLQHDKDPLALLALGATETEQKQFPDALEHLKAIQKRLPSLQDYVAYLIAADQFELEDYPSVEKTLRPVFESKPISPLLAKAILLQANAYLKLQKPHEVIDIVEKHLADLTEPQADILLARAYEMSGDTVKAAARFQHIYVEHPTSDAAKDAETALIRYGKPAPPQLLIRCSKLIDNNTPGKARVELAALLPSLSGADLERARVLVGVAEFQSRLNQAALTTLNSFHAQATDVESQRLSYLAQAAKRLDNVSQMNESLTRLSELYPQSKWRLPALVSAADFYARRNEPASAEPLYRACEVSFPNEPQSAGCHWKVAFATYLRDQQSAVPMLRDHIRRYPDSEDVTGAMYFLARAADARGDLGAAHAWYQRLVTVYPNFYYAMLARDRLMQAAVAQAPISAAETAGLVDPHKRPESFTADLPTKTRIERARLLASAGLDDLADSELRFAATADSQPQVIAVALAQLANERDQPEMGIRYIKKFAPGYLYLPVVAENLQFLRLAFPLPYREPLETYSKERQIDPYLVAGLVRQESEFNAKALSRAQAYGLTQVLPSTGRDLSRRIGLVGFRADMLYQPETSLRLGTFYLRMLLDELQGQWEATLASYNAGKSYVTRWLTWSHFREPAEFVETIPIAETRNYVQSVLRNADVYRRLYTPPPPRK
jgi:soluble lytic murein transglycosylase